MPTNSFLTDTFTLTQKTALITGTSSGIGAHIATTLARAGCAVALAARREDKLESIAQDIRTSAPDADVITVTMDVTNRTSVETAFKKVTAHFNQLNILINNAGIADSQNFLEMTESAWQKVLDTDLTSVWRVGQIAARAMQSNNSGGVIINLASILGTATQRKQANYGAAKAGVIHLTKTMALELAAQNIRVNALAPGYFATEINRAFLATPTGKKYIASLLPARAGNLPELDGAVLLLASDAGSYINGSILTVDGGSLVGGL